MVINGWKLTIVSSQKVGQLHGCFLSCLRARAVQELLFGPVPAVELGVVGLPAFAVRLLQNVEVARLIIGQLEQHRLAAVDDSSLHDG